MWLGCALSREAAMKTVALALGGGGARGLAHIAVATRPGHELKVGAGGTALDAEFAARRGEAADLSRAVAGRIVSFTMTALEISATAIRQRLAAGLSARYLVPDAVLDYIDSHQIYRTPHGH